jgi:hypothetical protein
MRFDRTLIGALLIWILAFAPSACGITISVGSNAGGFTESINADEEDAVYSSTVIAANSLSHSIKGSGSFKESHSVSNTAGANAGVGVDIRQAEWYSYSYDLWPGEGSSWPASKFAQVAASEQLDVLNAKYIQAYANAHNSKGYTAGVSTVISDPGREASLTGYRNLAMASKNEAFASQTADGAFSPHGFIQADSGADFTQLKSRPLQFRWDTADASTRVDRGLVEGYSDLASASAQGIWATQQIDAATGEQIRTRSESESWTASLFQGLKTANAKVSTRAEGDIIGYNARAGSSEGYAEADQKGHIVGSFTSTALAGKASKTRTSNYGEEYDFDMQAKKDASGSYATGTLGYYVDNVSPLANRIQGAVDASESGDAVNVAPGNYYENVQIDKSLNVIGAGASDTIVDGQQSGSVFVIGKNDPNVDVALSGMTIQGGSGSSSEIFPGYAELCGGGILNYGTINLEDGVISGNTARFGGGIANIDGTANLNDNSYISNNIAKYGGGFFNYDNGTVNLNDNNYVSDNTAMIGGGFLNYVNSTVNLNDNSYISDNIAEFGGGFYNFDYGIVNMNDNNYVSDNTAIVGGGIFNTHDSTVSLNDNSYISDNIAEYGGGGVYNIEYGIMNLNDNSYISDNTAIKGGGVFNTQYGTVNLNGNSYISDNIAEYGGGGVYNIAYAIVNMNDNSYISDNIAGYDGGGIFNSYDSSVHLNDKSYIRDNVAEYEGGGIFNTDGSSVHLNDKSYISDNIAEYGGGIFNTYSGTVNLNDNSYISKNIAEYDGGGVYNYGTMNLKDNSSVNNNTAIYCGGGILNEWYGTVNLNDNSYISKNIAEYGGGVYNYGTMNLNDNNYITGNTAAMGGGIFNHYIGMVNLNHGSIDHNNATSPAPSGGGIYNLGTITGDTSIVHDNTPDQIALDVDWLPEI